MSDSVKTGSPRLALTQTGALATLALTCPERRNCIDLETWQALPPLLKTIAEEEPVRVLILRGAGEEAFSAGADLAEFDTIRATAAGSQAYERANVAAFDAVRALPFPTIALIHGYCFGAGMGLAAACDLRIAADDARFAIPAARIGVGYPPDAMQSLVTAMGTQSVKRLFFLAEQLDAKAAYRMGFVSEVVAKPDLDAHVTQIAQRIADGAPLTLRAAKAAIDLATAGGNAAAAARAQSLADACFASADYVEGRAAFRDKRKPVFRGE